MNTALGRGLVSGLATLTVAGTAIAAEPAAKHAGPISAASMSTTAPPAAAPSGRKPLDLRIGDVRNYMMPREYLAALGAPDADANTVVVEGQRALPIRSKQPIPGFPPLTLWWALRNPSQSWRILAPDVNAPPAGPPSVVPPPIFRPGP
jgi:hypothetical protein